MAKVMISLPEELLVALDAAVARTDKSRSAFIRDAVRERLARASLDERDDALRRLRGIFREVHDNPEDLIRAERER